jgi:hypothetical protein
MTCIACEEARRVALAFYDKMAASIRQRVSTPVRSQPVKYHDRAWAKPEESPPNQNARRKP